MSENFAIIGAAGYIAPKHLQAIHQTGNQLVAATDPHDNVGRLDAFFPEARYFKEIERFDRHLEKLRRGPDEGRVKYVSVCTPNYLHDAHVRLALRIKADAICEKPLVIAPWNLDALEELEAEHNQRVYNVLQLRLLPSMIRLREEIQQQTAREKAEVCLTYVTRRGRWYDASWKGSPEKSGGVSMNIGIHFFDVMLWLFGQVEASELHLNQSRRMSGALHLERATIKWFLSTDADDLPDHCKQEGKFAFRSMTLEGQEIEFSNGFTDLHTQVYQEILAGRGTGIKEARPAIELVHQIKSSETSSWVGSQHPLLKDASHQPSRSRRAA
ncbi:Gfo/Idh/MocA family oxidoreductase [Lignipirellula cremea]|uniref:UDP-N-acetyl-2-amino-2-deoxy-D-glucuronate oxidase n=1 Tax=Lignipirellula cremea TaxID=2528010 RepID=A0A518E4N5_9BACT|nr:Gfo/Idh/MocA family oxidoreductase [Lignipirellula cremea]QDU99033.1 UDP-N-acetyl-2-amino-2-deoxy-D-glucuronate oxidase [Lignipirellula cremea]